MSDYKALIDFISAHWALGGTILVFLSLLLNFLKIESVKTSFKTKHKGKFYCGWDAEDALALPAANQQVPALPKVKKTSKKKHNKKK